MTDRRIGACLVVAVFALAFAVRAEAPEDWDGIGFLSSMRLFDLAAFSPHPPGYPVYVVLLRAFGAVISDGATAAATLSATFSGIGAYCTFSILAPRVGVRAALAGAATGACGTLVLRAASQVGTESVALGVLLMGLAAMLARGDSRARSRVVLAGGLLAGLGLGVRLSWWPLYAALVFAAHRGERARAGIAACVGAVAWALPLALIVGPPRLATLMVAHGEGHATRFGRTLLHDGDVRGHAAFFARDLVADGLGVDATLTGAVIAILSAAALARFVVACANGELSPPRAVTAGLAAYALFVLAFQNVAESPRHVVPLVYALTVSAATSLALPAPRVKLARLYAATSLALLAVLLSRGVEDALARRREPPIGAALVVLALEERTRAAGDVAVFGADTARFAIAAGLPGGYAEGIGDVDLALGAMPKLPARVLVTSEVALGSRARDATKIATLCRRPRLDRKHRCIDVFEF